MGKISHPPANTQPPHSIDALASICLKYAVRDSIVRTAGMRTARARNAAFEQFFKSNKRKDLALASAVLRLDDLAERIEEDAIRPYSGQVRRMLYRLVIAAERLQKGGAE